jgi:hypothetical protein
LSEKKDVYSEVKGQMRLSERIAGAIPGFRGYKEKELRRESDKLIRNHIYRILSNSKDDLKSVFQKISDRRYLDVLADMDRLVAKVDRISEKINHASYGYTGFYDAVKVKENNLDNMIAFDNQLIDQANTIVAAIKDFKAELSSSETKNMKLNIQDVTDKVESLEETFDKRQEVVLGVN